MMTARSGRPQANPTYFPGLVIATGASSFFRGARWLKSHDRWLKGRHRNEDELGTVAKVEMSGVLVQWIASAHLGTDQQLVQDSAPPAYHEDLANLTYLCSDSTCFWAVADRCFLREEHDEPSSSSSSSQNNVDPPTAQAIPIRKKKRSIHTKQLKNPVPMSTMTVSNTHTTVDVLWQDGTRQHGAPSTSLAPFNYMNAHEVFPGQYVVDADVTRDDDDDDDDVVGAATESARRIGVVKSVNSKDHTVDVSWFKAASLPDEANRWEAECDATVSAYDLDTDHDHSIFYGDIVVRLQPDGGQSTTQVQQPLAPCNNGERAPVDLSWVGWVVDLHGGHVKVKWGDGITSTVFPHEISVVNMEHYTDLGDEMGDWVKEDDDNEDDDDEDDDEEGDDDDDDGDPPQEIGAANTGNDLHDPRDNINVEGGTVEVGEGSVNEVDGLATTRTIRLCHFIRSMIRAAVQILAPSKWNLVNWSPPPASDLPETAQNVEVHEHVSTGTQQDPSDASVNKDDSAEDVEKIRVANRVDDPSNFQHFDVVQSPPDHHYLDSTDMPGSNGGKKWVKAVQKEWKILENSLPDTIYMRAFEDRMDLLRAAMVGASGTPYQNGLFFFDLQLPPSYPDEPPQVYYHSFGLRLNPNLDESGTVCLSLLDTFGGEGTELWSPGTSSLLQVVVSIQALVLNDQPFYNEDGYRALVDKPEGHRNALPYSENAFLLTLRTMLHLLRRPPQGFEGFIKDHFRRRGKHVLGTCEAYLRGCVPADEGAMELPCSAGFKITLANMVPRLVAAFTEIGAEGCNRCPSVGQTLI
uniref:Uncharacterized protein n=1 Tax=Avena sativa TaxID=4498 RepID=A0ACD5Z3K5_AVESA